MDAAAIFANNVGTFFEAPAVRVKKQTSKFNAPSPSTINSDMVVEAETKALGITSMGDIEALFDPARQSTAPQTRAEAVCKALEGTATGFPDGRIGPLLLYAACVSYGLPNTTKAQRKTMLDALSLRAANPSRSVLEESKYPGGFLAEEGFPLLYGPAERGPADRDDFFKAVLWSAEPSKRLSLVYLEERLFEDATMVPRVAFLGAGAAEFAAPRARSQQLFLATDADVAVTSTFGNNHNVVFARSPGHRAWYLRTFDLKNHYVPGMIFETGQVNDPFFSAMKETAAPMSVLFGDSAVAIRRQAQGAPKRAAPAQATVMAVAAAAPVQKKQRVEEEEEDLDEDIVMSEGKAATAPAAPAAPQQPVAAPSAPAAPAAPQQPVAAPSAPAALLPAAPAPASPQQPVAAPSAPAAVLPAAPAPAAPQQPVAAPSAPAAPAAPQQQLAFPVMDVIPHNTAGARRFETKIIKLFGNEDVDALLPQDLWDRDDVSVPNMTKKWLPRMKGNNVKRIVGVQTKPCLDLVVPVIVAINESDPELLRQAGSHVLGALALPEKKRFNSLATILLLDGTMAWAFVHVLGQLVASPPQQNSDDQLWSCLELLVFLAQALVARCEEEALMFLEGMADGPKHPGVLFPWVSGCEDIVIPSCAACVLFRDRETMLSVLGALAHLRTKNTKPAVETAWAWIWHDLLDNAEELDVGVAGNVVPAIFKALAVCREVSFFHEGGDAQKPEIIGGVLECSLVVVPPSSGKRSRPLILVKYDGLGTAVPRFFTMHKAWCTTTEFGKRRQQVHAQLGGAGTSVINGWALREEASAPILELLERIVQLPPSESRFMEPFLSDALAALAQGDEDAAVQAFFDSSLVDGASPDEANDDAAFAHALLQGSHKDRDDYGLKTASFSLSTNLFPCKLRSTRVAKNLCARTGPYVSKLLMAKNGFVLDAQKLYV